jgi:hypothetical protein
MNTSQQPGNALLPVPSACGNGTVDYPDNVEVCGGELHTTADDGGATTSLAMYPRQPFDFSGRTGTIVFDVNNDATTGYTAWPELWVTDTPAPDPFVLDTTWEAPPHNGFGVRFAGCTNPAGTKMQCPDGSDYVGVDGAATVADYAVNQYPLIEGWGDVRRSAPGQVNHYQIEVSQDEIDIYGTDAFTPGLAVPALKHIATIPHADLNFTRGLVWFEDDHYGQNTVHTFNWDNVGFDGPVLPRDLGFDVPNPAAPNEGYSLANSSVSLVAPGITQTDIQAASGALLTFNFYSQTAVPLNVAVNGHRLSVPWPFSDHTFDTTRTIAVPVPLADVVDGGNTVSFTGGNYMYMVENIDLILQGAGR